MAEIVEDQLLVGSGLSLFVWLYSFLLPFGLNDRLSGRGAGLGQPKKSLPTGVFLRHKHMIDTPYKTKPVGQ